MTTTTTKWNIQLGDVTLSISGTLAVSLGYGAPYSNDESNTARYNNPFERTSAPGELLEAYAKGYRDDEAARHAIALASERKAAQSLETARQKIAEIEAKAAADRRAAEGIALAAEKLRQGERE